MTDAHSSFEDIYNAYNTLVYNVCLHYLQNKEDAEETTQDVFVQVYRSLAQFQAGSSFKTWLYRITINKCLDHIRSKKRKKRFGFITQLFHTDTGEPLHEVSHFDHPGVALANKERATILFTAIDKLPDKQRTAFILSQVEKLPQRDIAGIMEMSEKAIESLVQRAKASLRKQLGNLYDNQRI